MEKFILKQNGKEVKIGDKLVKQGLMDTPLGRGFVIQEIIIDEETIPELLRMGVIEPIKENKTVDVPVEITFYIEKIANKMNCHIKKVINHLNAITLVYPAASASLLLKEVAIELDKKYKDHISKSPEIYVISVLDGQIVKANKDHIKNYRNFAAFRSIEDAKTAYNIVKPFMEEMFKDASEK